jgi:methanogenic corrinoid protein MtbC1
LQHTIGLFIVSEFFRHAGWRVWGEPIYRLNKSITLVFSQWFDVIGISVGFEEQLVNVNQLIQSLRSRSMNPNVAFMVGGPLYNSHPELFDDIEADIKSSDANDRYPTSRNLCCEEEKSKDELIEFHTSKTLQFMYMHISKQQST